MASVKYTYECAICHATFENTFIVSVGQEAPRPCEPGKWRVLSRYGPLICGNHKVEMFVDGKKLEIYD